MVDLCHRCDLGAPPAATRTPCPGPRRHRRPAQDGGQPDDPLRRLLRRRRISYVRIQTIDTYYREGLQLLAEMLFQPALTGAASSRPARRWAGCRPPGTRPAAGGAAGDAAGSLPRHVEGPVVLRLGRVASVHDPGRSRNCGRRPRRADLIWTVQTNPPVREVEAEIRRPGRRRCRAPRPAGGPVLRAGRRAPDPVRLSLKGKQGYVWAGKAFRWTRRTPRPWKSWSRSSPTLILSCARSAAWPTRWAPACPRWTGATWLSEISMGTRPENLAAARDGMRAQVRPCRRRRQPARAAKGGQQDEGAVADALDPVPEPGLFHGPGDVRGPPAGGLWPRLQRLDKVSMADLRRVRVRYFTRQLPVGAGGITAFADPECGLRFRTVCSCSCSYSKWARASDGCHQQAMTRSRARARRSRTMDAYARELPQNHDWCKFAQTRS